MEKYVPVKGHSGLVRDTENNALININRTEIEQARERKKLKQLQKEKELSLHKKVDDIEAELSEIKNLLKDLINKSYK